MPKPPLIGGYQIMIHA